MWLEFSQQGEVCYRKGLQSQEGQTRPGLAGLLQDHGEEPLPYFRPGTYDWIFIWTLGASLRIRVNLEHTWSAYCLPGTGGD